MREAKRLGIPEDDIGNGEFQVYYEMIREEMMRKLNLSEATTDISVTPVTVYTEYALPAGFGALRGHEIVFGTGTNSYPLKLRSINELPTVGNLTSGTPHSFAIFNKNDGLYYLYLYPLSGFTGTLRIRYKVADAISAGSGAGTDLTKTVPIGQMYIHLLIHGVIGQLIPDLDGVYQTKLQDAIYDRPAPTNGEVDYNFGGLDGEDFDNGFSKNFNGDC
jgi:hypothetical protein